MAVLVGLAGACVAQQEEPGEAQAVEALRVWPGAAPSTEGWTGAELELDADLPAGEVHIVTNIATPTISIDRPAAGKANGTAMLVLPGAPFARSHGIWKAPKPRSGWLTGA